MSNSREATESGSGEPRGFLGAAIDPRIIGWYPQLVVLAGFIVIAAVRAVIAEGRLNPFPVLVVAPAAWALQWGLTWVAYRAFFRRSWWQLHRATTATGLLIITAVVAIVTAVVFAPNSGTTGWTIVWRWAVLLMAGAVIVLSQDYRRDLQFERELQVDLNQTRERGLAQVTAQRDEVVSRMLGMWQEAVAEASTQGQDPGQVVKTFAREQVRPLSHELMRSLPPIDSPRQRPSGLAERRELLERVLARPLVRPLFMAFAVTILFVLTTVETTTAADPAPGREGFTDDGVRITIDVGSLLLSLFLLAVVFLATWGSAWLMARLTARALPRLTLGRRVLLALATPIVIALAVEIVVQVAYILPGLAANLSPNLIDRLWLALPIVLIAFLILVTRILVEAITTSRRRTRQANADLNWENSRLLNTLGQERRFFATQLHGPIQSAAAASALRLEAQDLEDEGAASLLVAESDLTDAIRALGQGPPGKRNVESDLADLVSTWTGVCAVHCDVSDAVTATLDADWISAGVVMDLLVDAVANAAMHGRAKNVWIRAELIRGDELQVDVINDGDADLGDEQGLGSALLDESCIYWTRQPLDGGVKLEFAVAVPASELSS